MAQEFWLPAGQPAERAALICSGLSEAHIRRDLQRTSNAAIGQKNQPELLRLFFRDALDGLALLRWQWWRRLPPGRRRRQRSGLWPVRRIGRRLWPGSRWRRSSYRGRGGVWRRGGRRGHGRRFGICRHIAVWRCRGRCDIQKGKQFGSRFRWRRGGSAVGHGVGMRISRRTSGQGGRFGRLREHRVLHVTDQVGKFSQRQSALQAFRHERNLADLAALEVGFLEHALGPAAVNNSYFVRGFASHDA